MAQPQGYQQRPGQINPAFYSGCLNVVAALLKQYNVPQQVASTLLASVDVNNSSDPRVMGNARDMMGNLERQLATRGMSSQQQAGIHPNDLAAALYPWVYEKVSIIIQQMQQPQQMMGGYQAQPQGYQQPGQFAIQPPSMFSLGNPSQPQPVAMPTPPPAPLTQHEFRPAPPAQDISPMAVPTRPQREFRVLNDARLDLKDPKVIQNFNLGDNGIKLIALHKIELSEEIEAVAAEIESVEAANDDAESADLVRSRLPEALVTGEYAHRVHYKQIYMLGIGVKDYLRIRTHLIRANAERTAWNNIITVLSENPQRIYVRVEDFLVRRINERMRSDFRAHSDIKQNLQIEVLEDLKDIFAGGISTAIEAADGWRNRLELIVLRVVKEVFLDAEHLSEEHSNFSDLIRCHDISYPIGGISKFDLPFIEQQSRSVKLEQLYQDLTILRIRRSYLISNTLSAQDLQQQDLFAKPGIPDSQQVFWLVADVLKYTSQKQADPAATAVFFSDAAGQETHVLGSRIIVRTLESGSQGGTPDYHLHLVQA